MTSAADFGRLYAHGFIIMIFILMFASFVV